MNRRGLALLIVVGVLGILAVLAAAFLTLAQLERRASRQRLVATKALLLARAGIEDALARLGAGQDPSGPASRHLGEDSDASGALSGVEKDSEIYKPGQLDTEFCPVRHALRPSFYRRNPASLGFDGLPMPEFLVLEGRSRGFTGQLMEGSYTLKVKEGGIYVNGGDPAQSAGTGYNAVLQRVLGNLAEALDREDGMNDGLPVDQADGQNLVGLRPAAGWRGWAEIRAALGPAKGDALRPYLVLETWVDHRVIKPNPVPTNSTYASWADLRAGRITTLGTQNPGPAMRRAPDFERIGGKNVGRAPVDLAWARHHRPVLIALLADLKGLYLDDSTKRPIMEDFAWRDLIGTMREAEIDLSWTSAIDECRATADAILLASTTDFSSWDRFNDFCDTLSFTGTTALAQAKRDVLKANFNPNSALNKFNPNRSRWKRVDKQDLATYSTEFCLDPLQPHTIESHGRLLNLQGKLLASRTLGAVVSGSSVVRISTQREFVAEDLGDPFRFGDEGDPRLPGFRRAGAPDFLSRCVMLDKAWGHRINASGQYPGTWLNGSSNGLGLQSYPEPCATLGGVLAQNPADYDGSLQLATVETALDDWYTVSASTKDMKCLARFDESFDLDEADGTATCQPDSLQVSGTEMVNSLLIPLGASLAAPPKLNTLMPDGCYSERGRTPAYLSSGNMSGYRGILSMWVKRNYDLLPAPQAKRCGHAFFQAVHFGGVNPILGNRMDHQFWVSDGHHAPPHSVTSMFFEICNDPADDDINHEILVYLPHSSAMPDPAVRRWSLLTTFWDFRSPDAASVVQVHLDQGGGARSITTKSYEGPANAPNAAQDLTLPDEFNAHRFALGYGSAGAWDPVLYGAMYDASFMLTYSGHPDATLDEVAVYDFGGATLVSGIWVPDAAALDASGLLASSRWQDGRYYKGWRYNAPGAGFLLQEAASWHSAPVSLASGSRIHRVSWSWTRPAALPDDYPEVELVNPAATAHLWTAAQSRASRAPGWTFSKGSWSPGRSVTAPFRVKVGFSRVTPAAPVAATPILESPTLDDITVLVVPPGGPGIRAWTAGDE
jgi:hypothetical protein